MNKPRAMVLVFVGFTATALGVLGWRENSPEDSFARLVRSVGERRFVEPRLTGGFAYAPCTTTTFKDHPPPRARCSPPVALGSAARKELITAIHSVRGIHKKTGIGAEPFHRGGVADLLASRDERAVMVLREAVRRDPGDAQIQSDLAAALYVLAQEQSEPATFVEALAMANNALRLASNLPEAQFNRALILEKLFLISEAGKTWDSYLKIDGKSAWGEEARRRRDALNAYDASTLEKGLGALRRSVLSGDPTAARAIARESPQAVREWATEELLGEWGDLVIQGRLEEAQELLRQTRALGEALRTETREPSVAAAVAAVDRASGSNLFVLAAGHRAYRDGQQAYRKQLLNRATIPLEEARKAFLQADSPMISWSLIPLAGIDVAASHYEQALEKYNAAWEEAQRSGSRALAGRAAWGVGQIRFRQGLLSESLARFLEASASLEAAREEENLGAVLELVAENLRFLGQYDAAWRYRYRAAAALASYRGSLRFHNVLWEGGWATAEVGEPRSGLDFLNEGVTLATRSGLAWRRVEALLWRSKVRLALNELRPALDDLLMARDANDEVLDAGMRARLAADLDYIEGEVRRSVDPESALLPLSRAVAFYQKRGLTLDLPGAYLARFYALKNAGHMAVAQRDLESALAIFERRGKDLADVSLRVPSAEKVQGLYDEMLLLRGRDKAYLAALEVVERARALAEPEGFDSLSKRLAAVPRHVAVLEYARAGDHLFVWLIYDRHVKSFSQTIAAGVLEQDISAFVSAIERRNHEGTLDTLARTLYRFLIPAAVAELPAGTSLMVIPDKALNSIPFAALQNPETGRYLVEDLVVRIAPSLAKRIERRRTDGQDATQSSALLVAATKFDPDLFGSLPHLPGAAEEIQAIGTLYGKPRFLTREAATKERLLEELENQEVFHFAGHAVFNARHPEDSYFVLAPTRQPANAGLLFLREIAGRHLARMRLVVLSACETVGPLNTRTGGTSGLARPFLDAGVEAVVATLWSVGDQDAARMLPEFHRHYLASGDAAEALRAAQLTLLRGTELSLRHPVAWAAFQAIE